jgi:hypothetical protein
MGELEGRLDKLSKCVLFPMEKEHVQAGHRSMILYEIDAHTSSKLHNTKLN